MQMASMSPLKTPPGSRNQPRKILGRPGGQAASGRSPSSRRGRPGPSSRLRASGATVTRRGRRWR
eukprot:3164589-Heterocapsa_arctica.AAC.1